MTWPVVRTKYIFASKNIRGMKAPLASATMHGVELRGALEQSVWNPGDDVSNFKLVEPGDFVIGLRSFQHGISYSSVRGLVSPAYTVLTPRTDIHGSYYKHYFRSRPLISLLENIAQGIRQGRVIDMEAFWELALPIPPKPAQLAIAAFLDVETARIDALIAKKRVLAERLGERVGAVIDLVTWAGAHTRMALRRVATFVDYRGATPSKSTTGGGIPLVTASHVRSGYLDTSNAPQWLDEPTYYEWMRRGWPTKGDVLLTTEAPLGNVAQVLDSRVALAQRIILLKPNPSLIRADFLALALQAPTFRDELFSHATGSTAPGIKADRLKALNIPVPPLDSQDRCIEELVRLKGEVAQLDLRLKRQINLLREHRQALITAYVTGQSMVRRVRQ